MLQDSADIARILLQTFYGSTLGNQVDSLPSARPSKAVWKPHGVLGPAPIDAPGPRKNVKLKGKLITKCNAAVKLAKGNTYEMKIWPIPATDPMCVRC